eukprot:1182301-Prorocentrum_minimum.AAC.1
MERGDFGIKPLPGEPPRCALRSFGRRSQQFAHQQGTESASGDVQATGSLKTSFGKFLTDVVMRGPVPTPTAPGPPKGMPDEVRKQEILNDPRVKRSQVRTPE